MKINGQTVLLSIQRALLGNVTSSLRAVTVSWKNDILLYFDFVDKHFIKDLNVFITKIINLMPLVIAIAGKEKNSILLYYLATHE